MAIVLALLALVTLLLLVDRITVTAVVPVGVEALSS
jgi:hypothetical protein